MTTAGPLSDLTSLGFSLPGTAACAPLCRSGQTGPWVGGRVVTLLLAWRLPAWAAEMAGFGYAAASAPSIAAAGAAASGRSKRGEGEAKEGSWR